MAVSTAEKSIIKTKEELKPMLDSFFKKILIDLYFSPFFQGRSKKNTNRPLSDLISS